jgi:hypothetical protein
MATSSSTTAKSIITIEQVYARYACIPANTPIIVKASGQNTMIVEKQLQAASKRYSHSWLINLDCITQDYWDKVEALFDVPGAQITWSALNGASVVIKVRIDHGQPDPVLPFRGQEVSIAGATPICTKELVMLTVAPSDKNGVVNHYAGLPLYEVRSYQLVQPQRAKSFAELMQERAARKAEPTPEPTPEPAERAQLPVSEPAQPAVTSTSGIADAAQPF